jgi:2-oxoisovalerate dehydrogenase E1 component
MFLEHKHLDRQTYNKASYQGPDYMIPFGKAAVVREGLDLVIFTWGALVQRAIVAAQQAERDGISAAVVDLRTIVPLDWDTIAAYTRKTNRVIVAHEDQMTAGFGGDIASRIGQELFDQLDAPVTRIAALYCPVAYAPVLEEVILPGSADVLKAIRSVAAY